MVLACRVCVSKFSCYFILIRHGLRRPDVHFHCDINLDPFMFMEEHNKTYCTYLTWSGARMLIWGDSVHDYDVRVWSYHSDIMEPSSWYVVTLSFLVDTDMIVSIQTLRKNTQNTSLKITLWDSWMTAVKNITFVIVSFLPPFFWLSLCYGIVCWYWVQVWSNFEIADMDFWRGEAYSKFFEYLDSQGGFYYEVSNLIIFSY